MQNNNEKHCAFCKAILFDDDDIVYCPVCGAPHHRSCYNSLGHCAMESMHGKINAEPEQTGDRTESGANSNSSQTEQNGSGRQCPRCGRICTNDMQFCPSCGWNFNEAGNAAQPPFGFGVAADPYGGVDPASEIEGEKVSDVATYVRVNTARYVPKFKSIASRKGKSDWNWSGFLFSYSWLMYRKCWIEGIVTMLFTLVSYFMMCPVVVQYYRAVIPYANMTQAQLNDLSAEFFDAQMKALSSVSIWMWLLFFCGIVLGLFIHVYVGLRGDCMYMSRALTNIRKINSNSLIEDKQSTLAVSGGINIFIALICFYGMQMIFRLILSLLLTL